ncbi:cytochrome P450 [Hygrophoropsis aurantiaca]|uniref:Cytochrome P450 n=1 Tax=Hygrophoropsis aurantiaca TaxID=72124 RepID=A0ACB8AEH5_9AGAM|nr:cytochrome P450 [Hygrophoropsis aurantiaca]
MSFFIASAVGCDFTVLLTAGIILCLLVSFPSRQGSRPLPPGPHTGWFTSFRVPNSYQWITYAQWSKIYGDIIYVYVFGNPVIVLNSAEAVEDLLEKRSKNYSSRPVRTMVVELMGWDWLFSSMPYGQRWKDHRKLFRHHFHPSLTSTYYPVVLEESYTTLRNLLRTPENYNHHIRRTAAAIVMKISYGHDVSDQGDVYVTLADEALQGLGKAGIFGTFLVDYLPCLKYIPEWVPGADFKRQARIWRTVTRAMIDKPFRMVKDRMADGTAVSCFAQKELEKCMQTGQDSRYEDIIKNVAGISYTAGADTVTIILRIIVIGSTDFEPDRFYSSIREAQKEIDRAIGTDRLPTFDDRNDIPFLDCIVWESLRWNPVLPMGVAHYVSEEDEYRGYHIPKGTSVLANVWAILHDETCYPDPSAFNPARFSDPTANSKLGINQYPYAAFGFGRRMCPGRWLAFDSMWIAVASILSVYSIQKPTGEDGHEITPSIQYTSSLLSRPNPFKCRFIPRSEKARSLIQRSAT